MTVNIGGGVHLPYDPEDLESLAFQPKPYGIWFVCPVCKNRFKTNLEGIGTEPCCTGPHLQFDEHPLTIMVRMPE